MNGSDRSSRSTTPSMSRTKSFHDASSGTPDRPWKRRSIVTARTPANRPSTGDQSSSVRVTPWTNTTSGPSPPWSRTASSSPSSAVTTKSLIPGMRPRSDKLPDDARYLIGHLDRREVGACVELVHREPRVLRGERTLHVEVARIVGLRVGVEHRDGGRERGESAQGAAFPCVGRSDLAPGTCPHLRRVGAHVVVNET